MGLKPGLVMTACSACKEYTCRFPGDCDDPKQHFPQRECGLCHLTVWAHEGVCDDCYVPYCIDCSEAVVVTYGTFDVCPACDDKLPAYMKMRGHAEYMREYPSNIRCRSHKGATGRDTTR